MKHLILFVILIVTGMGLNLPFTDSTFPEPPISVESFEYSTETHEESPLLENEEPFEYLDEKHEESTSSKKLIIKTMWIILFSIFGFFVLFFSIYFVQKKKYMIRYGGRYFTFFFSFSNLFSSACDKKFRSFILYLVYCTPINFSPKKTKKGISIVGFKCSSSSRNNIGIIRKEENGND